MDRNLSRTARNWPAAGRLPVRSWLEVVKMARAEVGQGPARNCDRWSELLRDRSGAEEPTKKYCIQKQVKWIIAGQEPLATSTRNPGPELQWRLGVICYQEPFRNQNMSRKKSGAFLGPVQYYELVMAFIQLHESQDMRVKIWESRYGPTLGQFPAYIFWSWSVAG